MTRTALVYRTLYLGDFLAGLPALRMLRRALPAHEVVLATPGVLRPLVGLSGSVDRHLPTAELAVPAWSGAPPDVAIDLHGNGPPSKAAVQALRPGRVVAFDGPGEGGSHVPGPVWDGDEHETRRWCRLVATAFDVRPQPGDLALARPNWPSPAPGAVVVHPGAASRSRQWPVDRFAAVARWAERHGLRVVVTGGPTEVALAREVAQRAGLAGPTGPSGEREDRVLAGRTDLLDLAALVADATAVVSGDTGIAHLASAFGTPSVVLFGPVPPSRWGPPAEGPHVALWHGDDLGDPHGDVPDPALLRIGVDEVVAALAGLLTVGPAAPIPPIPLTRSTR